MLLRTAFLSLLPPTDTDRIGRIASDKQMGKWKAEAPPPPTMVAAGTIDPATGLPVQPPAPPAGANPFAKLSPNAAEGDAEATATNEVASEKVGKPLFGRKPKKAA